MLLIRRFGYLVLEVWVVQRLPEKAKDLQHHFPVNHKACRIISLRSINDGYPWQRDAINEVLEILPLPSANVKLAVRLLNYRIKSVLRH
jgi:hypothetical protein